MVEGGLEPCPKLGRWLLVECVTSRGVVLLLVADFGVPLGLGALAQRGSGCWAWRRLAARVWTLRPQFRSTCTTQPEDVHPVKGPVVY